MKPPVAFTLLPYDWPNMDIWYKLHSLSLRWRGEPCTVSTQSQRRKLGLARKVPLQTIE